MKLGASRSNALRKFRLDVHVHILEVLAELKLPRLDFGADFKQTRFDLAKLLRSQNSRPEQGPRMCDAASNVLAVELPIHMHRGAIACQEV